MKVKFEFEERVIYAHSIGIEIEDDAENGFEEIANSVANEIERNPENYDRGSIVSMFSKIYGDAKVNFTEDGSPNVEYEAI